MQPILIKQYLQTAIPVISLFMAFGLARQLNLITAGQFAVPSALHSIIFVLSVITAIAGPVFFRTLFAHSMRKKTEVPARKFLSFQKRLLWISQITPYLAFAAVLCDFSRFYAAAIVLMALYAGYYYFPSKKRIHFDRLIFRVK